MEEYPAELDSGYLFKDGKEMMKFLIGVNLYSAVVMEAEVPRLLYLDIYIAPFLQLLKETLDLIWRHYCVVIDSIFKWNFKLLLRFTLNQTTNKKFLKF